MIYISLPCFVQNLSFNNFFKDYVRDNKDKLKINFDIEYSYGSFPWSVWNGGYNSTNSKNILYQEMIELISYSNTAIRIDCSNTCLQKTDYYDRHQNIILDLIKDAGNTIDISDINLLKFLQEKDKHLQYIVSNNAEIYNVFNEDIINLFLDQTDCLLITLNNLNTIDLNKINHVNKCELIIGNGCSACPVDKQLHCIKEEHEKQIMFSGKSNFYKCPFTNSDIDYIKEISNYKQITHFKIATPPDIYNLKSFNIHLIENFVKPEFQLECIKMFYGE